MVCAVRNLQLKRSLPWGTESHNTTNFTGIGALDLLSPGPIQTNNPLLCQSGSTTAAAAETGLGRLIPQDWYPARVPPDRWSCSSGNSSDNRRVGPRRPSSAQFGTMRPRLVSACCSTAPVSFSSRKHDKAVAFAALMSCQSQMHKVRFSPRSFQLHQLWLSVCVRSASEFLPSQGLR